MHQTLQSSEKIINEFFNLLQACIASYMFTDNKVIFLLCSFSFLCFGLLFLTISFHVFYSVFFIYFYFYLIFIYSIYHYFRTLFTRFLFYFVILFSRSYITIDSSSFKHSVISATHEGKRRKDKGTTNGKKSMQFFGNFYTHAGPYIGHVPRYLILFYSLPLISSLPSAYSLFPPMC